MSAGERASTTETRLVGHHLTSMGQEAAREVPAASHGTTTSRWAASGAVRPMAGTEDAEAPGCDTAALIACERALIRRARSTVWQRQREHDELLRRSRRLTHRADQSRARDRAELSAHVAWINRLRADARALLAESGWGQWVTRNEQRVAVRGGVDAAVQLRRCRAEAEAAHAEVRARFGRHRAGRGPLRLPAAIPVAVVVGGVGMVAAALVLRGLGRPASVGLSGAILSGAIAFALTLAVVVDRMPGWNRTRLEPYLALETLGGEAAGWFRAACRDVERRHRRDLARLADSIRLMHERDSREHLEGVDRLRRDFVAFRVAVTASALPWTDGRWWAWTPPATPLPGVPFGVLHFEEASLPPLPAIVPLPGPRALVIRVGANERVAGVALARDVLLRLLTAMPPGGLRLTFLDPVGRGQSAPGSMGPADGDAATAGGIAWVDPADLERRLAVLTEHIENVTHRCLRGRFVTVEEYNRAVGEMAEPYRVLAVFDYPAGFSAEAVRRLKRILHDGPRCGVYTILVVDDDSPAHQVEWLDDLADHTTVIAWTGARFVWQDEDFGACRLEPERPAPAVLQARLAGLVETAARSSGPVVGPLSHFAAQPAQR